MPSTKAESSPFSTAYKWKWNENIINAHPPNPHKTPSNYPPPLSGHMDSAPASQDFPSHLMEGFL